MRELIEHPITPKEIKEFLCDEICIWYDEVIEKNTFGTISINTQNGKFVSIKREETKMITDYLNNIR